METLFAGISLGLGVVAWILIILIIVTTFAALTYLPLLTVRRMAANDFFFTIVNEGEAKAIMHSGQFHRCVMAWRGHRFQSESEESGSHDQWEIVDDEERPTGRFPSMKPGLVRRLYPIGGIRWLGLPGIATVHTYDLTTASLKQREGDEGNAYQRVEIDERIGYTCVPLKFEVYAYVIKAAEMKGALPVDIVLLLKLRVRNVWKSLFNVSNWLEDSEELATAEFISELRGASYEDYIADNDHWRVLKDKLQEDNSEVILKEFGVQITDIEIHSIDPPENLRELTLKEYAGEREAARLVAEAVGIANAARTKAGGEADAFATLRDSWLSGHEPTVAELIALRALQVTEGLENLTVISEGVGVVPMINVNKGGSS